MFLQMGNNRKEFWLKEIQKSTIEVLLLVVLTLVLIIIIKDKEYNDYKTQSEIELAEAIEDKEFTEKKIQDLSQTIVELNEINETINNENIQLAKANDDYYVELEELAEKVERYETYDYAMFHGGRRTDITYEQLVLLEDLLAESSIKDQDLILAWVMVESAGKENAQNSSSSAKGYGQFLDSTAKYSYTVLLGEDGYYPEIALDGDTNLRMMVAYLDYLYEYHNHDLYATIDSYTGGASASYIDKLNSYLAYNNKSVNSISKQLREMEIEESSFIYNNNE